MMLQVKAIHLALLALVLISLNSFVSYGQENIIINAMGVDGMELSKQTMLNFQVQSQLNHSVNSTISGKIQFKQTGHWIKYSFEYKLNPGVNNLDAQHLSITWDYSSSAIKELFTIHNVLPSGLYQYCITVIPLNNVGEFDNGQKVEECMYNKVQEVFMINLLDPSNNAKLYEYNPSLSWIANYSFSSDLNYRLRVAEINKGQNPTNALQRNKAVFQESDLHQNTMIYPVSAKPLEAYQPYAWAVDAYYKNILLGSSEVWKFIIIEDSITEPLPKNSSFIDVNLEHGINKNYAINQIKLKYELSNLKMDTLQFELYKEGKLISMKPQNWIVKAGENKLIIDLKEENRLKHGKTYVLKVKDSYGKTNEVIFMYVNTDFL